MEPKKCEDCGVELTEKNTSEFESAHACDDCINVEMDDNDDVEEDDE